jgi:diguanylate cyclase (GGDEF)-like protein
MSTLLDCSVQAIRVLVADDDEAVLDAYRQIFHRVATTTEGDNLRHLRNRLFAGGNARAAPPYPLFDAHYCRDAEQAVATAREAAENDRPFAVIFLDMRMPPGPDGAWAAARIRELDAQVDIVIATAYSDVDPREINRQAPPESKLFYVQKPFHPHEVRQLALALGRKWEAEARVRQLAYYDSLTGLPNRVLFLDRLAQALESARRHNQKAALLFLDLDNFKRINDTLGHGIGDELLKIMASRLSHCLRASDAVSRPAPNTAARLGGDEFTVLLSEIKTENDAAIVAQRILDSLGKPMNLAAHEVMVTPSIGIAVFPQDGDNVESLLKHADLAMYFAKHSGANRFQYFQAAMNEMALRRLTLENHLRQAIAHGELSLYYQPQMDLGTGEISGMEALLRWHNQELGNVPPAEFISVAEESGLILPIGDWILRTACQQAKQWRDRGVPLPRVAVNVSVMQFVHRTFLDTIQRVLAETGLEPALLELEITESLLMKDPQGAAIVLRALKALGVRVAIDDFGTGYSSLSRLKELPIDCLKIDRSFVHGINAHENDRAIATAVIAMAESMNLRVIAEGVETSVEADFLRAKRCGEMQGFLISRPLPPEQAESFLIQHLGSPTT